MDRVIEQLEAAWRDIVVHLGTPEFYSQIGLALVALVSAWVLTVILKGRVRVFRDVPQPGTLHDVRLALHNAHSLLLPIIVVLLLAIATPISLSVVGEAWLVRAVQGVAVILLVYSLASRFIGSTTIVFILKWIGVPIALLFIVGLLDEVTGHLESVSFAVGNIEITLLAVLRTFLFGILLFWFGRVSNATGQRVIRNRTGLDVSTREVVAKLFEIGIYVVMLLLLLNVVGIDLTALAVFGGALGVGLGFGLQQIASNFVSGIIILLDRSITIGDFIELEDGRSGTLRELTMRSATLETFDGKDIMVPNEQFITTTFVNWTHYNQKQRYSLNFQVAYDTDLEAMFEIVRETVQSHPKVITGDDLPIAERADAEIESFGDSGINILVEFWMEGIDDGDNRVGADLLMMIWTALRANDIHIPFPQREVRVLGDVKTS
ncbi:MAG: mechanosensitive ion channel [Rhodospirillaceae bacterium]|jgi:small-conductance mechanosensitive channel|nr:mechanosensitive ion channel [Rhodospirillaceae bacterium]MBT3931799.1 mechanosensitive ion channel [Rhodospirillaceae bacterium]MBT4771715.1 mechanosensitive ion channel [Rhodospirillaceae bacterium]MBT5357897.1 mechanosensitive ion channel [Rhodospirillaceae bacterium]MBT5768084.1 mechanosensitive ion channel [Rhodospirillaceae bacterium]